MPISDQRKTGRSLPVKLELPTASGERTALHQGSSGSPGKAAASNSQPGIGNKRRSGKAAAGESEGAVKAEVTSSRLRHGTGGASTSGESHSHADPASLCPDQADAVGGSGTAFAPARWHAQVVVALTCICMCNLDNVLHVQSRQREQLKQLDNCMLGLM